jgi:aspartyl-tRNA(Asn)/glutamyl-tRNA(Gln) amidotransferase subunit C
MSLDSSSVRRIAKLARIRVDEAQVEALRTDLNAILGWIEMLDEVDVSGVEPLAGAAQMAMRLREDVVDDGGMAEAVLANAPDRNGDYFAVPKVVE